MAADLTIKIENLEELQALFASAPAKVMSGIQKAIQRSIMMIESKAKRESPVNKATGGGNLRQSIKSNMRGNASGEVSVGAEYAMYVHEGTRPHTISVVNKRVLANRRTGAIFGRTVQHPGTRANPFLQRAIDQASGDINNEFLKVLDIFS